MQAVDARKWINAASRAGEKLELAAIESFTVSCHLQCGNGLKTAVCSLSVGDAGNSRDAGSVDELSILAWNE